MPIDASLDAGLLACHQCCSVLVLTDFIFDRLCELLNVRDAVFKFIKSVAPEYACANYYRILCDVS